MSRVVVRCPTERPQDGVIGALEVQEVVVGLGDSRVAILCRSGGVAAFSLPSWSISAQREAAQ